MGCLYGPSGCGKSFVAIDMALSVASGTPYLGTFPVVQSPVVYLSGEGNSGIKDRIAAWMILHELPYPEDCIFVPFIFDLLMVSRSGRSEAPSP